MSERTCVEHDCDREHVARGFCNNHYQWHRKHGLLVNITRATAAEYAAQRTTLAESGCWHWTGPKWGNDYGQFNHNGKRGMAHRFVFELHRGAIPVGLVLDHLCRNRICVNPDHLESVTNAENLRRGMSPSAVAVRAGTCYRGHEMTEDNIYRSPDGARRCRTCVTLGRAAAYQKQKAELGIPDAKVRGGCNEPGCEREHLARGMCKLHYQRAVRAANEARAS